MSLEQFIPLPDIETGPDHGYNQAENAFEEMRTPIFLIVFIGVLLVQIFYRQKKNATEEKQRLSGMGPLEKSLSGRAPNGKALSDKQVNEIRDIDKMLGSMGGLAGGADSMGAAMSGMMGGSGAASTGGGRRP